MGQDGLIQYPDWSRVQRAAILVYRFDLFDEGVRKGRTEEENDDQLEITPYVARVTRWLIRVTKSMVPFQLRFVPSAPRNLESVWCFTFFFHVEGRAS